MGEYVMVLRETLQDACSFDDGIRLSAQHAIEALLAKPAEQHQGEPVARVEVAVDRNACIAITDNEWLRALKDKGTHQVVRLYIRPEPADPGEVERLRKERRRMDEALVACANERDTLHAQLSERDALLRDWYAANAAGDVRVADKAYHLVTQTAALSASAEQELKP